MKKNTQAEPNNFQRFFWWCGGVVLSILLRYPKEWSRQTASGIFVFIVACIATIAMFGVLNGILQINVVMALLGSLFWGFTILSLDRVFLTNYRKGKNEFWKAVYRISVTVVCSLLITDMAMLGLFRGDINSKMETRKVDDQKEIKQNVLTEADSAELAQLKKDETEHQSKLDLLNQSVQEKLEIRDAEGRGDKVYRRADGTEVLLSGKPSHEREYRERNKEYEAAKTSLEAQQDEGKNGSLANNLKRIRDRIAKYTQRQDEAEKSLKNSQDTTRLLEMHNALSEILWDKESKGALYCFMLLWLVLILLESAPILQKFASRKNPYEQALTAEDDKAEIAENFYAASAGFMRRVYENLNNDPNAAPLTPNEEDLKQFIETKALNQNKTEIAQLLQSERQTPSFGKKIIFQIAGDAQPAGSIRIPSDIEPNIHFDDLVFEITSIEEEVRLKKGDVELTKVTNSAGIDIDRDFTPIVDQIEADGILILYFEPVGLTKNVTT